MARLCLFTELLASPFDEGYKNFTYNLFREAPVKHEVLRLGHGAPGVMDRQIRTNKLLLNRSLCKALRDFQPDAVVYVPTASITPASFVRSWVLKRQAGDVALAMIGLQSRVYSRCLRPFVRAVAPDVVYVQSEAGRRALKVLGLRSSVIRAGVDADKFRPARPSEKARLRQQYGVDPEAFVALHVGHINERRNLRVLGDVASLPDMQMLVVGSTSTPRDSDLATWLTQNGVRVVDEYVEHIEEVYQLCDLYVFPVEQSTSAIEFPLSVLEAMACNLPIVTTRFGGLTECFQEGDGFFFAGSATALVDKCKVAKQEPHVRTREQVEPLSWRRVADRFFSEIEQLAVRRSPRCG